MNIRESGTADLIGDPGQRLTVRCCSKSEPKPALPYDALQMKHAPLIRKKSEALKIEPSTSDHLDLQTDTD
jgi:hypothetical protein